jgi:hypothetical protein
MSIEFKVTAKREGSLWTASIKELDLSASHEDLQEALSNLAEQTATKIKSEFKSPRRIDMACFDIKATAVLAIYARDDRTLDEFGEVCECEECENPQAMLPESEPLMLTEPEPLANCTIEVR